MTTYERIQYRDHGRIKTATVKDIVEGTWTLSGTMVDDQGGDMSGEDGSKTFMINTARDLISRTPMEMGEGTTGLENSPSE